MFAGKVQMCQKWNSSRGDLSEHVQKNTCRVSLVFAKCLAVACHFIPHLVHAKTMQPSICQAYERHETNSTVGVSQSLSLASI